MSYWRRSKVRVCVGSPSHDLLVALSLPHHPFLSAVLIYLLYLRALKISEASSVLAVIGSGRDKRVSFEDTLTFKRCHHERIRCHRPHISTAKQTRPSAETKSTSLPHQDHPFGRLITFKLFRTQHSLQVLLHTSPYANTQPNQVQTRLSHPSSLHQPHE